MRFNSLQLQLPKLNEISTNVKFNVNVNTGGMPKYLILRQVRAEQYELKGGKSEVIIAENDEV